MMRRGERGSQALQRVQLLPVRWAWRALELRAIPGGPSCNDFGMSPPIPRRRGSLKGCGRVCQHASRRLGWLGGRTPLTGKGEQRDGRELRPLDLARLVHVERARTLLDGSSGRGQVRQQPGEALRELFEAQPAVVVGVQGVEQLAARNPAHRQILLRRGIGASDHRQAVGERQRRISPQPRQELLRMIDQVGGVLEDVVALRPRAACEPSVTHQCGSGVASSLIYD
mmetsp:Transcript_77731/g.224735  ORF Transcript_77731/g.224735 Transcript_77731/m.224735 type:complete len:227 (-) Transcript_77731:30-710(-)